MLHSVLNISMTLFIVIGKIYIYIKKSQSCGRLTCQKLGKDTGLWNLLMCGFTYKTDIIAGCLVMQSKSHNAEYCSNLNRVSNTRY